MVLAKFASECLLSLVAPPAFLTIYELLMQLPLEALTASMMAGTAESLDGNAASGDDNRAKVT